MIIQPALARADLVQTVARVTRVSLADLLNSSGTNAKQQQALLALLRGNGTTTARVVETRADGASVLELGQTRIALRLASPHAAGDLIQISMEDPGAPSTAAKPEAGMKPGAAALITDSELPAERSSLRDAASTLTAQRIAGAHAASALSSAGGNAFASDALPATAEAHVKLSSSGKLIQGIINSHTNQIASEAKHAEPLAQSSAPPTELARALQHAVRSSGLFYESHLQGWVDGRIPLKEIIEEPQARIADTPAPRAGEVREAVHPQLEHLVRQQLDTFERQAIAWQGFVWPDQQAEMMIAGEPENTSNSEAPRAWRVHLDMTTPGLGPLKIDVALTGSRLDVRLQGETASGPRLRGASVELLNALSGHGLDVNPIHVAVGA